MKNGATYYHSLAQPSFLFFLFLGIVLINGALKSVKTSTYIVQAGAHEDAVTAVESIGVVVQQVLNTINAVEADLTPNQVHYLLSAEGMTRIWENATVEDASSQADAFIAYPIDSVFSTGKDASLRKLVECDDRSEIYRDIPYEFSDDNYISFAFDMELDPRQTNNSINLGLRAKERSLEQLGVGLYQNSTQQWHYFRLAPSKSDNAYSNFQLLISEVVQTPEDMQNVEVRLFPIQNSRRGMFKVDCVYINFEGRGSDNMNAGKVWNQGNLGQNVGVAILDTGIEDLAPFNGQIGVLDIETGLLTGWDAIEAEAASNEDQNGHGTAIASIINNRFINAVNELYLGIAPLSKIIPIAVLNEDGQGNYADIIAGIQWAIDNKEGYNIRLLNMSLSVRPQSFYWDDPLNQAVMRAWQ